MTLLNADQENSPKRCFLGPGAPGRCRRVWAAAGKWPWPRRPRFARRPTPTQRASRTFRGLGFAAGRSRGCHMLGS